MNELVQLKHRLAVWEAMTTFLDDNFLSKDGRSAPKAIKVPDCLIELVPEDTIESVLLAVGEGPIAEIKALIDKIENQEVIILSPESKSPNAQT